MKLLFFNLIFLTNILLSFGQTKTKTYSDYIAEAEDLYKNKFYETSASTYSEAFKSNGWKGYSNDRYNAACSWAMAGNPDSAFFNLERIVSKSNFNDLDHITSDTDLNSLHEDKRWALIIESVRANKEKAETNLNKPL